VVAIDPRHPAHVDMRDHAALEAEGGVSGIVRGGRISPALLVDAFGDIGVADANDALDLPEQIVEHVAPVADHIEDDAASILSPVIPRWPLRLLPAALEHPVAELAAHREHAAEETGVAQEGELLQPRQEQLVLHRAVLDAPGARELHDIDRFTERGCDRLLAIDMLAGIDRSRSQPRS